MVRQAHGKGFALFTAKVYKNGMRNSILLYLCALLWNNNWNNMVHLRDTVSQWLPLVGLTFSAFIFNTSEFVPIGLLTDIAADFHITEARAGLLITIYAWVVAAASLPLMLSVSKVEFKRLLLSVVALFALSHVLSAVSSNYTTLMVSRIGVACAHAIFWSIASPLAVKVAPRGKKSLALSFIVTGTSVALIAGLPLGRIVGLYVGWRMTFFCIAVLAALVFVFMAIVFPKVPNPTPVSLRDLPGLVKTPALTGIYLLTVVAITGHYTGYSYIEPFMAQVAHLKEDTITFALVLFGLAGIAGSLLFSKKYDKHPVAFINVAVYGIAAFLFLLSPASLNMTTSLLLCVFWGIAITAFNLVFQALIIQCAPQATSIAMSIYSGIFNVGIGSGALLGGYVCTYLSIGWIGYVGGAISLMAALYCTKHLLPLLRS